MQQPRPFKGFRRKFPEPTPTPTPTPVPVAEAPDIDLPAEETAQLAALFYHLTENPAGRSIGAIATAGPIRGATAAGATALASFASPPQQWYEYADPAYDWLQLKVPRCVSPTVVQDALRRVNRVLMNRHQTWHFASSAQIHLSAFIVTPDDNYLIMVAEPLREACCVRVSDQLTSQYVAGEDSSIPDRLSFKDLCAELISVLPASTAPAWRTIGW